MKELAIRGMSGDVFYGKINKNGTISETADDIPKEMFENAMLVYLNHWTKTDELKKTYTITLDKYPNVEFEITVNKKYPDKYPKQKSTYQLLVEEEENLYQKYSDLLIYINTEEYFKLNIRDQRLLIEQLAYMNNYLNILRTRIKYLNEIKQN